MVIGLGVDTFDVDCVQAQLRAHDPAWLSIAFAGGVTPAGVVLES